jgi:phosphatidate cytidylyltransferase
MSTPPTDGRGPREPGIQRFPRVGAGVAEPAGPERPDPGTAELPGAAPRSDDGTGPVPLAGTRPRPPAPPVPARPPGQEGDAPSPAEPAGDEGVAGPADRAAGGSGTGPDEPASPDPAPAQPRSPGRAGRNLTAAIGVGLGLGAVIVASLVVWHPGFAVVVTAAVLVAVVELTRALRAGGFAPPLVPVLVGAVAMEVMAWNRGATGLVIAFLLTVLAVLLWRLGHGAAGYLEDASAGVLVALYVPLLAGFAVLLLAPSDGAARVLLFIATVVCNDVGGYAAGVLVGKHPMAPSISPKKSWEGLAGSVLACMLVATLILVLTFHRPWWGGLVFGAALAASATIGDLGESLIKRDLGIKDMGHLLPGHGGIMDRLDSLLPSAAVAYLLLSVLAPA